MKPFAIFSTLLLGGLFLGGCSGQTDPTQYSTPDLSSRGTSVAHGDTSTVAHGDAASSPNQPPVDASGSVSHGDSGMGAQNNYDPNAAPTLAHGDANGAR